MRLGHIVASIGYGAAFATLMLVIWRRTRGGVAFPTQPGHWLLLLLAVGGCIEGVATIAARAYASLYADGTYDYYAWNLNRLVLYCAASITCLLFLSLIAVGRGWRVLLFVPSSGLAIVAVMHGLNMSDPSYWHARTKDAMSLVEIATNVVLLAVLCVVALRDSRRSSGRDWLHWTGVWTLAALVAFSIGDRVYWILHE